MMRKLLVILGPTSTGKTDLALILAKKFNGEIIACDSRQVYVGLDIGTGKIPNNKFQITKGKGFWEIGGIRVWMYDVVNLKRQYSVADYVNGATGVIAEIRGRGKLPILVGGTGLYLKALIYGISSLQIPIDKKLRKKLIGLSLQQLQRKLKKISLKKWNSMNNSDQNNPRRLVRAIELAASSFKTKSGLLRPAFGEARNDILRIGLSAPRNILYEKINKKVYEWIDEGIVHEVKSLRKMGISKKRFQALGLEYAVLMEYLDGRIFPEEMIEKMQIKVRQYAKRQITWFKKEKNIIWFDITKKGYQEKIEKLVSKWYDNLNNDTKN